MTPVEAYQLYVALKMHFTTESYDFIKYNGKTKARIDDFEKRSDKYQFVKLAKKDDPLNFLLSNFVANKASVWIGELVNEQQYDNIYLDWKRRKESLKYTFNKEINQFSNLFNSLKPINGDYPEIFKAHLKKQVSIETLVLIDKVMDILPIWDQKVLDKFLWKDYSLIIRKYKPFLSQTVDSEVYKKIIKDKFNDSEVQQDS